MIGERRMNGASGGGLAGDIVTVVLPDRIDSVTAQEVERSMLDALVPGARVVIDGSAVAYMSAAGVRALATALRQAEERQARVVFCRFTGAAEDCLVVAGFSQLLDVVGSPEEAVAKLRSKSVGNPAERLHPHGATG
ncbi:STAS domain-containing protein [Enhydrobacter sp.]|jgi:anti-sigma B factor antagonist|uniref:STAS domain-containing protein n=1 Tax=Enhydrobacter sp. TaxID=1894999 RepID=UPI00260D404B|nr:STAS domain-containing protein [Enhydrobacter sp.]